MTDKVTIGVVNYNGISTIAKTLNSIQNLNYPEFEIIVVDNNSTDGSRELVQRDYPEVRCICLDTNRGLPGARNVILQESQSDYVLIMDNDMVFEPGLLSHLMEVMRKVPQAAACHPEILDAEFPEQVSHYNGGYIHYLCALVPRNGHTSVRPDYEIFDVVSGGALLMKRSVALQIGGFDEDYFFNWEDGDYTARLTLAGYFCLNVPDAVVYHQSKPRGTTRVFHQVRNRWFFILKLYSWRTIILISPMLLLFEVSQATLLSFKGAARDYWKGNLAVISHLPEILRKRRGFQKLKVKRDHDWLREGEVYLPQGLVEGKVLGRLKTLYFGMFNLYWKAMKSLC